MLNNVRIGLRTILLLLLGICSAAAQNQPASGMYRIVSGRYISCCGIAGPFTQSLPDAEDSLVELTVDLPNNRAEMRFLADDGLTVLRIPAEASRPEFVYTLTNGIVFSDHIQFGGPSLPSMPDQPAYSFSVTNTANALSINGKVVAPCLGCGDIPQEFSHTNVLAVSLPTAAIRVSEVEVCWNSASNQTYQAQYRSAFTTNTWVDLGTQVSGNGSTNCITDQVPLGQPQRFYRVLLLP